MWNEADDCSRLENPLNGNAICYFVSIGADLLFNTRMSFKICISQNAEYHDYADFYRSSFSLMDFLYILLSLFTLIELLLGTFLFVLPMHRP